MEVLYNILIEIGVSMKVVMLIIMFLKKTCSKVRIGKHLSHNFPIQNGLKQGDDLSPLIFNVVIRTCYLEGPGKPGGTGIIWDISAVGLC
jgi:hypothetical protein